MKPERVAGKNKKGHVMLFALSTCGWCKKTKALLKELDLEYYYIDVDQLDGDELDKVDAEVRKWNPSGSFPIIVIDNKTCITGYDAAKIKKVLGS